MTSPACIELTEHLQKLVRSNDSTAIISRQKQTLLRYEETNETFEQLLTLSSKTFSLMFERFNEHSKLLQQLKKDLEQSFKRIRGLKVRLAEAYPHSFQATSDAIQQLQQHYLSDDPKPISDVPTPLSNNITITPTPLSENPSPLPGNPTPLSDKTIRIKANVDDEITTSAFKATLSVDCQLTQDDSNLSEAETNNLASGRQTGCDAETVRTIDVIDKTSVDVRNPSESHSE